MAAFCGCCGAEITSKKAEACPECGAPTHGTLRAVPLPAVETKRETSQREESECACGAKTKTVENATATANFARLLTLQGPHIVRFPSG